MKNILIIEDNYEIALQIKKYLNNTGYEADIASSYYDALSKININIDVALLDINLPDRDGHHLISKLKDRDVRVIVTTVKNDEDFTILNEYQGDIPLYHFDCYRIGEDDFLFMGFEDYLYSGGVSILEWGERVEGILPDSCVKVGIDVKDGERFIDFKGSKRALELERMIYDVGTWS